MKKMIIFISIFVMLFGSCIYLTKGQTETSVSPRISKTIVLDAGHGGIDVGAVGKNGTLESDLNLQYCQTLKTMFEDYGANVIMTRENADGLYSEFKSGFKMEDMRKRREIIQNSNADLVISIHMNKFAVSSSRGAQVFYDDVNQSGKKLAETLQKIFINELPSARKEAKCADLYVLKSTSVPAILIECGFLSNPDEEVLLTQEKYRKDLCSCIVAGVFATIY